MSPASRTSPAGSPTPAPGGFAAGTGGRLGPIPSPRNSTVPGPSPAAGGRRRRGGVSRNAAPSGLRGDRAHRAGRPPARRPTRRAGGASAGTGPDLVPGHRADDRLVHPDRPPGGPPHLAAELHRRALP